MEEKVKLTESAAPQTEEENLQKGGATTPDAPSPEEAFLKIKFNKELIELDRETAITLAQKGMKYDKISEEYDRLKGLASESDRTDGMARITEEFPEITSFDMLPKEVQEAAQNSDRGLLFEYLLFESRMQRAAAEEKANQSYITASSTGSLSADDREDPVAAEFLRGVWGK